jgi:hypothetical protein
LELAVARRLDEVSSYPEKALADAARSSVPAWEKVVQRAKLAEQVPCFEAALAAGAVSASHVDALPGTLDLGRASRLANRAQRRALRALYAACAIPGCPVGYDHCKLHHLE